MLIDYKKLLELKHALIMILIYQNFKLAEEINRIVMFDLHQRLIE